MNRCGRLAFLAVVALTAVGCGEDEFSDEAYGALDLTPFYADGASAANPRAAVPAEMRTLKGWYEGNRAEFYDFGIVNHRRKRNAAGATIREPDIAYVNKMYFFFDSAGNPMVSKPLYDNRTGTWSMKGGRNLLDPNPEPANGNEGVYYSTPYSQRLRRTVGDAIRRVPDYQRPIIDKLANDSTYTGLWEVVQVKTQAGYVPDTIKSWKTLDAAIEANKVQVNRTFKVINCPVIEEATWVTPTSIVYRQARPGIKKSVNLTARMEIWYRTKLGYCFLATGFQMIGDFADRDPRNPDDIDLFKYGEAPDWDSFDVIRYSVGEGNQKVQLVEGTVSKLFIPRSTVAVMRGTTANQDFRYGSDDLVPAAPRLDPTDRPGYSPIVWLHDVVVPADPPYVFGSFKRLTDIDPAKITPRDTSTTVWTKNYPMAGFASKCTDVTGHSQCQDYGMACNNLPDPDVASNDLPSGLSLPDLMINREGGPRCDVKAVGFGEYCAPAVSRCETHVTGPQETDTILTKTPAAGGGPAWAVHKGLDDAIKAGQAMGATPEQVTAGNNAAATKKSWVDRGYPADFSGRGYYCQPNTSTGGNCYVRCDNGVAAGSGDAAKLKKMLVVEADPRRPAAGERELPVTFGFDARCGGLEQLGYKCLPGTGRPNRQRVCLRECTLRDTESFNKALCEFDVNGGMGDGVTPAWKMSAGQDPVNKLTGQTCNNLAGITACMWNPDFEPRHPDTLLPRP